MDELRLLIQTELSRQGLSYREAAERSQGLISYSHLNQLAQGRMPAAIDDRRLTGIALALDVPVGKVRKAYGANPEGPIEFVLPERSAGLTARQRKAILQMVDAFLDSNQGGRGKN